MDTGPLDSPAIQGFDAERTCSPVGEVPALGRDLRGDRGEELSPVKSVRSPRSVQVSKSLVP